MKLSKGQRGARGASFRITRMGSMPHRVDVFDAPVAADLDE